MNSQMNTKNIVIVFLLVTTIFFGWQYFKLTRDVSELNSKLDQISLNETVLEFTQSFIKDVLNAETEVEYSKRRQLDDLMDDIGDPELADVWLKLSASQDQSEARDHVIDLLRLLSEKIQTSR